MTEKQDRFSRAMEHCRRAYRDTPIPPELEGIASSLYAETKTPFSVTKLLRCILEELEKELEGEI